MFSIYMKKKDNRIFPIFLFWVMVFFLFLPDVFAFEKEKPPVVAIISFEAYISNGQSVLHWETENEYNTFGFNLYRFDPRTDQFEKLNDDPLPGVLTGSNAGIYHFIDDTAQPGLTYRYQLEELKNQGAVHDLGTFTVTVGLEDKNLEWVSASSNFTRKARNSKPKIRIVLDNKELSANKKGRPKGHVAKASNKKGRPKGHVAKASIEKNGLYFLSAAQLAEYMTFNETAITKMIKTGNLYLANQGEEIAWMPSANNEGIYFYGQGIDDLFTNLNVYWVSRHKGSHMPKFMGCEFIIGENTATSFTDTIQMEEDNYALITLFDDPLDDYWMWEYLVAGSSALGIRTYTFETPGPANVLSDAKVKVYLKGASSASSGLDHHVEVYVNDTYVGEGSWNNFDPLTLSLDFSQILLNDGANTLKLVAVKDGGVPYGYFYLDAFEVSYQRLYTAENNQLFFNGAGEESVTISGFTSPDIMVFDITNSNVPVHVINTAINVDPTGYQVSFVTDNPSGRFLALARDRVQAPLQLIADQPSKLTSPSNRADYVIITPEAFLNGALRLADYRSEYKTKVVLLEDIYDEFNNGLSSPFAIRDFLAQAYHRWSRSPRYVVLVGNGTYDYKNNLGYDECLMPPFMVNTPDGLFPADNRFVDVDGDDGLPDMAIGRLPALTEAELDTMLDKIAVFEQGIESASPWNSSVFMVTDNPDGAGNFPVDSDNIAQIVPQPYQVDKIYLGPYPYYSTIAARALIRNAFNQGAFLINYIGHSYRDKFAAEALLTASGVNLLTNDDRLPIVTAMTCLMGDFGKPNAITLSEALLMHTGGAAAVWTSTGLSYNSKGRVLDAAFFESVFISGRDTLGDAIMDALSDYRQQYDQVFIIDIYNLLGDPGLRIR